MTSKFEQLIEYVINDDEAKAKELFHDIVVEKSRQIYENLMDDESIGGDASDDLIDEVEVEEEGMYEEDDAEEADVEADDEAEEAGDDLTKDMEADADEEKSDEDLEDRVVDLEDKLDELMAEFESLMGDEDTDSDEMEPVDGEVGGDAYMDDDTAEFTDELSENVDLPAAPKPVTTEPAGTNTKSTTAFNSGAAGMASKPVQMSGAETNPDGTAPYKQPSNAYTKGESEVPDAGSFKNVPGKDGSKQSPAPKPVTAQAAGVNNTTPFPKG